jgi:hypothetical protein
MATTLKATDTIDTKQANSGGQTVVRTIAELNELISSEESDRLDLLEAQVGDYDPDITESTMTDDLEEVIGFVGDYEGGDDISTDLAAAEGNIDDLMEIAPAAFSSAPAFAQVAASAVLTSDETAVTDGSTVTVNDVTYTFKTALTTDPATVPNEILIGESSDVSIANLKRAINGEATEGSNYSTDTEQPTDVTATVDTEANTVTVTATTAGTGGNAYPKATDDDHLDWDGTGAFFTGGVDITAGEAGSFRHHGGVLYFSPTESTATENNWTRIVIDAAPTLIINDASASDAVALTAASQTVVITDNNEENIELPAATGSGIEIRIQNRNSADHDVVADGTDVIDADGTITLSQYASCVLVDVAEGIWAQY